MRIGIDAREIEKRMTGIGRYLSGFISYAAEHSPHSYFLYYSSKPGIDFSCDNVKNRIVPGAGFLWDHVILPRNLKADSIDIFFSPYYKSPWNLSLKSVITVHDLNPLFDKNFPILYRIYFKKIIERSLQNASFVFTVSNYARNDILRIFNIDGNKVIVNYNAIDNRFIPMDNSSLEAVLDKYGIDSGYILHISNLMPHKNADILIKAYSMLSQNVKDKYKLVIGGKKEREYGKLLDLVNKLGLSDSIIFLGFIDDNDLPYLYNGASVFVFPSIREGFGFPPAEAMACGVPVVTSNATSLPEIVGDAGMLVEPGDTNGFARAITKILTGESLNKKMIKKGLSRVRMFSIEKTASRILEIFKRLENK